MRHITPRWICIILGVLLLAVSDYVSSVLPLIAGILLLVYGIYGEREIPGEVSDEEYRITEEERNQRRRLREVNEKTDHVILSTF